MCMSQHDSRAHLMQLPCSSSSVSRVQQREWLPDASLQLFIYPVQTPRCPGLTLVAAQHPGAFRLLWCAAAGKGPVSASTPTLAGLRAGGGAEAAVDGGEARPAIAGGEGADIGPWHHHVSFHRALPGSHWCADDRTSARHLRGRADTALLGCMLACPTSKHHTNSFSTVAGCACLHTPMRILVLLLFPVSDCELSG